MARSLTPGALSAVDKTMEETFMKFAKSVGKLYSSSIFYLSVHLIFFNAFTPA